ncbi:hypothetical protein NUW58_g9530 [Xylaria curta]|uniref:Uncharacterized protein n=1 Tax=Xylaria curta TaxID=42375 RepID=A0ACC1MXD5_9PEZI|nr:hypothetical protein NUW58_g9530 [Xylaria curta]
MSKPYILLVPGSFVPAGEYDNIVNPVKARGYDMKTLQLPTIGLAPKQGRDTPATMYDDAAFIAKEVEALADEGREVVIVAHSYGGMPATQSTKGLTVEDRKKEGKTGGVARLAYMTILLAGEGRSASEVHDPPAPEDPPSTIKTDEKGFFHFTNPERTAARTFSDLPKEEGLRLQERFALHSAVSFTNPLTHAGYRDVPVSYLHCEEDVVIPSKIQKREIELIEKESGRKVDVTNVKAGHCPNASVPEKVIDWIIDTARKS